MNASLTLFRVFGIPVKIHVTWLLVAGLITWSLASGYFPQEYPGWTRATYWIIGAITAVLFFASVLIHELGHSLVARREGLPVRDITLFIFGGVASISREPASPGAEFRMAIAGPLTSLVLGAVLGLLVPAVVTDEVAAAPAVYLGRINVILALFNLIPGFPLDGGRVLRSILWKLGDNYQRATRWAARVGRAVAFLFILAGAGLLLTGNLINGLWIAFIGWFLNNAAESSSQQAVLHDLLAGVKARDVMTQQCAAVASDVRVDALVHDRILGDGSACFFVSDNGRLEGLVTLHNIKQVPRERWDDVTVSEIMTPTSKLSRARPDEDALTLIRRMEEDDVSQVPVMDDGHLLGVVTREHLLRYIRTRSELGV